MKPSKFYYCFLLLILSTSVVLLSLSYAKESGKNVENTKDSFTIDGLQIMCNKNCSSIKTNEEFVFSITNLNKEEKEFSFTLFGIDLKEEELYINGEKKQNIEFPVYSLSPYEMVNDFKTISIKIVSKKDVSHGIKISPYERKNTLEKRIKEDPYVYQEENEYRYYGENPANYLLYNNELYQIIGLVEEKIKLISSIKGLSVYKKELDYPTLKDYMKSFGSTEISIKETLLYKSWMMQDKGFWLKDEEGNKAYYASKYDGVDLSVKYVDIYYRNTIFIPKDLIIVKGDGSITSPYEVSYESE